MKDKGCKLGSLRQGAWHMWSKVQCVTFENQKSESQKNHSSEMDVANIINKATLRVGRDWQLVKKIVNLSTAKQVWSPENIWNCVQMTLPMSLLSSSGRSNTSGSVANTLVGWITTPCLFFVWNTYIMFKTTWHLILKHVMFGLLYELGWLLQQAWPGQSPCGRCCVHLAVPSEGRGLCRAAAWAKPVVGRTSPDWRWPLPAALTCCDVAWTSPPV